MLFSQPITFSWY